MRRGDIVLAVGRGEFSTKPRPTLVIQADAFADVHPSVTVCPLTSHVTGDNLYRVPMAAGERSGLREDSEIAIDLMQAIRRERLGRAIGVAPDEVMSLVDDALRRWLAL